MNLLLATHDSEHSSAGEELVKSLPWPSGTRIQEVRFVHESMLTRTGGIARLQLFKTALARLGMRLVTYPVAHTPAATIVDAAERFKADLVVIGSGNERSASSIELASVAAQVVDHARWPVLVARQSNLRRVLLADDGSPSAVRAEKALARFPALCGIGVQVVSIAKIGPSHESHLLYGWGGFGPTQRVIDLLLDEQKWVARAALERLRSLGINAEAKVGIGSSARALILAASKDASLIVMGSRGRTGLRRALLGSVAIDVLRRATCSILIVPGRNDA